MSFLKWHSHLLLFKSPFPSPILYRTENNTHSRERERTVATMLRRSLTHLNKYYHHYDFGINPRLSRDYNVLGGLTSINSILRRFESTEAAQLGLDHHPQYYSSEDDDREYFSNQGVDFPGGMVNFTSQMSFIADYPEKRVPCFRVLDDDGRLISDRTYGQVMSKEMARRMYSSMITLGTMDTVLYEAQRQGRISFYLTSHGEEAINIASAAALSQDDVVFPQYREPGVLLWRGFTLQEFANQCFGNKADYGKGRQMPIHYGSNKLNYFTISSPIATQLPQAAGAAYSLKMENKNACVVAYMGDGCTSEGDFHAGMNFAAVMEVPIIFFCRNNGWAISTPVTDQFRSDGIVVKGQGYGIQSIRVDGNDALAVYNVVKAAREIAVSEKKPVLVEALTYRVGHHSTSDDSTKYRPVEEIQHWRMVKSPVTRFRRWIESNGWWDEHQELAIRDQVKKEMIQAIQVAEKMEKPAISEMFADVYEEYTKDMQEQERLVRETIKRYPKDYPSDIPL